MPDPSDVFPTFGVCKFCGVEIKYSPVKMPAGPPMLNAQKPGHYDIEYIVACRACTRENMQALSDKIDRGEMYASRIWDADKEGNFTIVPFSQATPLVEVATEGVGIFRRVWRWIY